LSVERILAGERELDLTDAFIGEADKLTYAFEIFLII